jgi:hypothetical protein
MKHHTPTITMTGTIAPAAAPGTVVVARWVLENHSPLPVAANVYLRTAPAPLAGVACKGGRTQVGRFHGGVLVSLEPRADATIVALVGPVDDGELRIRATAVTDGAEAAADLVTLVRRDGQAA